jgi:hypothetical protein
VTTHRRAGRHLPGAGLSRRDPRRTRQCIYQGRVDEEPGRPRPASHGESRSPDHPARIGQRSQRSQPLPDAALIT